MYCGFGPKAPLYRRKRRSEVVFVLMVNKEDNIKTITLVDTIPNTKVMKLKGY